MKYKELWEQMCQRCDELDKKLADQEQPPVGFITNARHRLNFEPNATGLKDMPKTIDWKIPVYVSPQPSNPLEQELYEALVEMQNIMYAEAGVRSVGVDKLIVKYEAAHGIKE